MSEESRRIRVEEVQWSGVLSWTRLFNSFRMAIQPSRLLLALVFVLLCFLGGKVLDFMWSPGVYNGEIAQYAVLPDDRFDSWREDSSRQVTSSLERLARGKGLTSEEVQAAVSAKNRFARTSEIIDTYYDSEQARLAKTVEEVKADTARRLAELDAQVAATPTIPRSAQETQVIEDRRKRILSQQEYTDKAQDTQRQQIERRRSEELNLVQKLQPLGVFEASSQFVLGAFDRGVLGAASLNFGLGDLLHSGSRDSASVAGAMRDVFITLPGWLYRTHFWFMLVYALAALALWAVVGGAITRMAALDATIGKPGSPAAALEFCIKRFVWFFLTPLFPFILCGLLSLVLLLAGLVFFNAREVWVLDVAGGLLFGVALVVGLIIAVIVILTAAGGHLFYPALAVEGTDTFDAMSRSFGYVIARPWRWLFYTLVSMVYFAVTYLFVGLVLFLTLTITQGVVSTAVFRNIQQTPEAEVNRFDAMLPQPELGHLVYQVQWSLLDTPGKIAAALIWVWVFVMVSLLAAFAISFYANVHVWIYLLLRRSVDGTAYDEVFTQQPAVIPLAGQTAADKVDPATPDAGPASQSAATPPQEPPGS